MRRFLIPTTACGNPTITTTPTESRTQKNNPPETKKLSHNINDESFKVSKHDLLRKPITSFDQLQTREELLRRPGKDTFSLQPLKDLATQVQKVSAAATEQVQRFNDDVSYVVRKSQEAVLESIQEIRRQDSAAHRLSVVSLSGLAGYLFGLHRGPLTRLMYSLTGGVAMATICYPAEYRKVNDVGLTGVRQTIVFTLMFLQNCFNKPPVRETYEQVHNFDTDIKKEQSRNMDSKIQKVRINSQDVRNQIQKESTINQITHHLQQSAIEYETKPKENSESHQNSNRFYEDEQNNKSRKRRVNQEHNGFITSTPTLMTTIKQNIPVDDRSNHLDCRHSLESPERGQEAQAKDQHQKENDAQNQHDLVYGNTGDNFEKSTDNVILTESLDKSNTTVIYPDTNSNATQINPDGNPHSRSQPNENSLPSHEDGLKHAQTVPAPPAPPKPKSTYTELSAISQISSTQMSPEGIKVTEHTESKPNIKSSIFLESDSSTHEQITAEQLEERSLKEAPILNVDLVSNREPPKHNREESIRSPILEEVNHPLNRKLSRYYVKTSEGTMTPTDVGYDDLYLKRERH